MVIFQRVEIVHHKKEEPRIEDISFESQKELALKIEEQIKRQHKHSDGSPVILSTIESSKIETILSEDERNFIKPHQTEDLPKYQSKSEIEPSSKGLYLSEAKAHFGPVFVCTCGTGFSAGKGHGSGIEIYKIDDYHESDESSSYAHKPEPISDSYAQIIKYK